MSQGLLHFNDENFQQVSASGLVLVDFYAEWCGPCKAITPIIEQLAVEFSGQASIGKLNVDEAQKTTATFSVTSIPTLILFKDGKEVKRFVGMTMKAQLKEAISKNL